MAGLNKVELIGYLGKDPEIRRTQDGRPIANFSVATSEEWKDKHSGEKKERTEWHRVVCFNEGLCGVIEQYLKKGSRVYIEGKMQTRKYTDKEGIERYTTEVVMQMFDAKLILLTAKGNSDGGHDTRDYGDDRGAQVKPKSRRDDMDDEIPF